MAAARLRGESSSPLFLWFDVRRSIGLAVLLACGLAPVVQAQDSLRGKRLYLDAARIVGSGVSCVDCHGGLPGGAFAIGAAANDPARVERAVNAVPQMTPFRGRLVGVDFVDLAAYIGNPGVPSPDLRVSTSGLASLPSISNRLEFGLLAAGQVSASSTVHLVNQGAVAMRLSSGPRISGANAADFEVESSDCAALQTLISGASCSVRLRFRPTGGPAPRSAAFQIDHDWIGGTAAVALLGSAQSETAAAAGPANSGGGGAASAWLLAGLMLLALRRST